MKSLILLCTLLSVGCASGPKPPPSAEGEWVYANARQRGLVPVPGTNYALKGPGYSSRVGVPVPMVPTAVRFVSASVPVPSGSSVVREGVRQQQVAASATSSPVRTVPRVTHMYMLRAGNASQCPSLVRVPIQHTAEEQQHEVVTLDRLFSSRGDKERGIHTALEPVGGGIEVQGGVATLNLTAPPWRPDDKKCKSGLRQLEKTLASIGLKRAIIRVGGAPWERVTAQQ